MSDPSYQDFQCQISLTRISNEDQGTSQTMPLFQMTNFSRDALHMLTSHF